MHNYTVEWIMECRPLMEGSELVNIARDIFQAPFCLLAHDYTGEGESASKYTYANRAALDVMGGEWSDIVGQPSSLFDKDTLDRAREEGMKHIFALLKKAICEKGIS